MPRKLGNLINLGADRLLARRVQLALFDSEVIECDEAGDSDTWCTPPAIWKPCLELTERSEFALDPATNRYSEIPAAVRLSPKEDGLAVPWDEFNLRHAHRGLWVNPPYSKPAPWIEEWVRAESFRHRFLLVKCATGSAWFQPLWIFADLLLFFRKRQRFLSPVGPAGSANFDSVLAYSGPRAHALAVSLAADAEPVWTGRNPLRKFVPSPRRR